MELKNKWKQLRMARHMTQSEVADRLGVSAQTVSKWERGLLSPDIMLLPRIAVLFRCSIDAIFDMDRVWSTEHRQEFEAEVRALYAREDWEGVYRAWMREIELNPDEYRNYPEVMLHVLRKRLFAQDHMDTMISLSDHAEKCCTDDDIRNEIYRIMLQICAESHDPRAAERGISYYRKLPLLRHSREVYAKYVLTGEEYRTQIRRNILYLLDLAECSIRQLILPDMLPTEKIFYYQRAAALYEAVLDDKYAGFYDPPLLCDYRELAVNYVRAGQPDNAAAYIRRIFAALERQMNDAARENRSPFFDGIDGESAATAERLCQRLLQSMRDAPELEAFRSGIVEMQQRYAAFADRRTSTRAERGDAL